MPIPRVSFSATGSKVIGNAAHDTIGTWVLHVSGTFTGDLVPKGYLAGNGLTASDADDLAYSTAADPNTLVDPGATPISAVGVYYVKSDALHVVLDYTHTSDGPILIDCHPLDG